MSEADPLKDKLNKKQRRKQARAMQRQKDEGQSEEAQIIPNTTLLVSETESQCTTEKPQMTLDQSESNLAPVATEISTTPSLLNDKQNDESSSVISDLVEASELVVSATPSSTNNAYVPRRRLEIKSAIPNQSFENFNLVPPKKQPVGRIGEPVKVYCNHFPVKVNQNIMLYQYDALVEKKNERFASSWSEVLRRDQRRCFVQKLADLKKIEFSYWYDEGKNFYSTKMLSTSQFPKIYELAPGSGFDNFRLTIKGLANSWSTSTIFDYLKNPEKEHPFSALRILDTLLKQVLMATTHCEGSIFYRNKAEPDVKLPDGFQLRLGFFQSLCLTQAGLTLNLQTTMTKFYPFMDVLDFMSFHCKKDLRTTRITQNDYDKVTAALNGCKITTKQSNYTQIYKVRGFSEIPERQMIDFQNRSHVDGKLRQEKRKINLIEYYASEKEIKLQYPALRCLKCFFLHDKNDAKHIPIELCRILEWQECERESAFEQRERHIHSVPVPEKRYEDIMNSLRSCSYKNPPVLPLCREVSLSVDDSEMKLIQARILPQPVINNNTAEISKGRINLRGRFLDPVAIKSISFAYFSAMKAPLQKAESNLLEKFIDSFQKVSKQFRMGPLTTVRKSVVTIVDEESARENNLQNIENFFREKQKESCSLVVCILHSTWTELRATIKMNGTVTYGITTQCVMHSKLQEQIDKFNKFQRGNPDRILDNMCENLLRKINFKLQGRNTRVTLPTQIVSQKAKGIDPNEDFWQFMGADVIHPVCRQDKPSIAAVVGSADSICSSSAVRVCKQWPKTGKCAIEAIIDLRQMVIELLEYYRESNKSLPNKVVFYRDGVDDGQFSRVLNFEIPQIKNAFTEMYHNEPHPLLTFIVVKKRHNTRFFMLDERNRTVNIPPGLVVDSDIVHPNQFSFFLNSHKAIQGTNRPALYHVLHDEIKFTPDELQLLTYYLCFTDPRSPTSEAIPSLIHQADLAASNARDLFPERDASTNDGYAMDALEDPNLDDIVTEHLRVHEHMRDVPHFG